MYVWTEQRNDQKIVKRPHRKCGKQKSFRLSIHSCSETDSSVWKEKKQHLFLSFLFVFSHVTRRAHSDHETVYCNLLHLFTVIMIVKFKGAVSQAFCQEFKTGKKRSRVKTQTCLNLKKKIHQSPFALKTLFVWSSFYESKYLSPNFSC